MTRFACALTLVDVAVSVNPDGSTSEIRLGERDSFANRRTVGASAYMAARAAGLHPDAEVQLRSSEYSGQQLVEMGGRAYDVEAARDTGEFTVLTLRERVGNVR